MTCRTQIDRRKAELARIHILKADLHLDDDSYRDMLFTLARVRSAADLDAGGRQAVLDHMRALTGHPTATRPRGEPYPGRPHNIDSADRGPLLRKIEALLTDAHRPWTYAEAMARRMCKVERLEFCTPAQLRKIVAALSYDAKRNTRG